MPHHFGGPGVIHGGRPDGKDSVFRVKSSIVQECLMLLNSSIEWHIIVFGPTTARVKEKDWVLVAEFQKLDSGIFQE